MPAISIQMVILYVILMIQNDDNDGMPDVYEDLHNFLSRVIAADALQDEDGDSFNNLSEYHAVTNPDKCLTGSSRLSFLQK